MSLQGSCIITLETDLPEIGDDVVRTNIDQACCMCGTPETNGKTKTAGASCLHTSPRVLKNCGARWKYAETTCSWTGSWRSFWLIASPA